MLAGQIDHLHQEVRRRDTLDGTELTRASLLSAPHVSVPGWAEAYQTGTGVLTGDTGPTVLLVVARPGHGSSTFLRRLCAEQSPPSAVLVDLEADWDTPVVSRLPLEPDRVYLLELKNPDTDTPSAEFLDRLPLFGEQLRGHRSRLMIVVAERMWEQVDSRRPSGVPVVHLRCSPDPQLLVERHLQYLDHTAAVPYVRSTTARQLIKGMTAVEATRAVHTVLQQWRARPAAEEDPSPAPRFPLPAPRRRGHPVRPDGTLDQELSDRIEAALGDWRVELDLLFDEPDSGPESGARAVRSRCLLLSLAVHRTGPASTVDRAALALEQIIAAVSPGGSYTAPTAATVLSGRGLRARLTALGARVDPHDHVVFDRTGYAEAVLGYVWDNFTPLRTLLLRWLVQLPTPARPAEGAAARALVELLLRHKNLEHLDETRRLAVEAGRIDLLAAITRRALQDEHLRRGTWQLMTNWARTSSPAAQAVVEVCRTVLASPDSEPSAQRFAMTRLRHVAQGTDTALRARLIELLDGLASDGRTRDLLLREVDSWLTRARPAPLGRLCLLALMPLRTPEGTGPWLTGPEAPIPADTLGRGLADLLTGFAAHPEVMPRTADWLRSTSEDEASEQVLLLVASSLTTSAEADPSMLLMSALEASGTEAGRLRNELFRRMLRGTPQGGHPEWGDRPAVQPVAETQPVYGP
ncbi:hypothetical protein AB0O31_17830 [Kitasatospora cineracea]|uniref:hypothetical protein n=1 Tax=Kitasatospora cineracea TaxID=88074 RepID=UPI00343DC584